MTESSRQARRPPEEPIPAVLLDNERTWRAILPDLERAVLAGRFVLGPEVERFERAAAAAFGCAWAVGTSSGTSALTLALRAAPLSRGARVAVPANTFFAVLEAVDAAGLVPVVVDHDEDYVLSPACLEDVDVEAVVAVHLYGLPGDMQGLTEMAQAHGWWVLEDASQAHGATVGGRPVGGLGDAAAFSAYPTKNLGAWGDAGFVTGNQDRMRDRLLALRHHGQLEPNVHTVAGGTERIDAIQAMVLSEKLSHLEEEVAGRRRVAGWYREALDGLGLELPGDRGDRVHAYHQFVVRVPDRDRVRARLLAQGIGTGIHYPTPIHLQPGARGRVEVPRTPKRAEQWAPTLLSLPMYPGLRRDQVARVASGLIRALRSR